MSGKEGEKSSLVSVLKDYKESIQDWIDDRFVPPFERFALEKIYQNCEVRGVESRNLMFQILMEQRELPGEERLSFGVFFNHLGMADQVLVSWQVVEGYQEWLGEEVGSSGGSLLTDVVDVAWPMNQDFYGLRSIKYFPFAPPTRAVTRQMGFKATAVDTSGRTTAGYVDFLRSVKDVARTGGVVIVAPEGTRSKTGGMQEVPPLMGKIASMVDVVLLVGITGTENIIPRNSRNPFQIRPSTPTTLTFGNLIDINALKEQLRERDGLKGRGNRKLYEGVKVSLMTGLAELLPEQYRGVWGGRVEEGEVARQGQVAWSSLES